MKLTVLTCITAMALSFSFTYAQTPDRSAAPVITRPGPTPNDTLVSNEIGADRTATFRIYAPNARTVVLDTEAFLDMPSIPAEGAFAYGMGGKMALTKDDKGVWTFTTPVINPGTYRYTFKVDGVTTVDPRNPLTSQSLNSVQSLFSIPGAGLADERTVPHGNVVISHYFSKVMQEERRLHVYLPPGYSMGVKYPVLYLLHGGGDTDDSWTSIGRAGDILDNLIAAGKAKPMVVVMPAGHVRRGGAPISSMGQDEFSDDLLHSVIPFTERTFSVSSSSSDRALAGLSMGGIQTLDTALLNPSLFSFVGVFSSGWFAPALADFETKNTSILNQTASHNWKVFYFRVGDHDIARENGKASVEMLRKHGYRIDFAEVGGWHAWSLWRKNLIEFAPMLFQNKQP